MFLQPNNARDCDYNSYRPNSYNKYNYYRKCSIAMHCNLKTSFSALIIELLRFEDLKFGGRFSSCVSQYFSH